MVKGCTFVLAVRRLACLCEEFAAANSIRQIESSMERGKSSAAEAFGPHFEVGVLVRLSEVYSQLRHY